MACGETAPVMAGQDRAVMDEAALRLLLDQLAAGDVDADEVVRRVRRLPFTELGYAMVDHHRTLRQGLPEAVYGPGKTPAQCVGIVGELLAVATPIPAPPGPGGAEPGHRRAGRRGDRRLPRRPGHRDDGGLAPGRPAPRRGGGGHGRHRRPAGGGGVPGHPAGLRVRGRAGGRRRCGRSPPAARPPSSCCRPPMPSWWWPAWRAPWPAWSAACAPRPSWPCRPAWATAPAWTG